MNCPASRWRRIGLHQSPPGGGATGTSVGGSATGATLAPAPPRLLLRRHLAGLAAAAEELPRRLRLEPEAAADIFLWVR